MIVISARIPQFVHNVLVVVEQSGPARGHTQFFGDASRRPVVGANWSDDSITSNFPVNDGQVIRIHLMKREPV
jgi:hypothetical protein